MEYLFIPLTQIQRRILTAVIPLSVLQTIRIQQLCLLLLQNWGLTSGMNFEVSLGKIPRWKTSPQSAILSPFKNSIIFFTNSGLMFALNSFPCGETFWTSITFCVLGGKVMHMWIFVPTYLPFCHRLLWLLPTRDGESRAKMQLEGMQEAGEPGGNN